MAKVIKFRTPERAGGFYTCSEPGNNAGRYVREADYNALLERHRRLVEVSKEMYRCFNGYDENKSQDDALTILSSALAEEVEL